MGKNNMFRKLWFKLRKRIYDNKLAKNIDNKRTFKTLYDDYIKRLDVAPKTTGRLKTAEDYEKEVAAINDYKTPYTDTCVITQEQMILVQQQLEGRVITRLYIEIYFERIMKILKKWEKELNDS